MEMVIEPKPKKIKRRKILQTTLELISEHGFHGTPISSIAEHANVGAGTIYRYFKNKEELIAELYKALRRETVDAMQEGLSEQNSVKQGFRKIWDNLIRFYLGNSRKFLFLEQFSYSPFSSEFSKKEDYQLMKPIFGFFNQAIRKGILKPLPIDVHVALSHGPIVSLVKMQIHERLTLTEELMNNAFEACWEASSLSTISINQNQ